MSNTKTAVLLMAYGTPRSREEILPYYTDIRRGRPPTEEQLSDLTARYEAIGGLSPLAALTEAQRDALQTALNNIAPNTYHVALGLKHAAPMIEDAVQQLAQEGFTKIVALVLAPHFSSFSIGQYIDRATTAAAPHGISVVGITSWATEEAFIEFLAADMSAKLATMPANTSRALHCPLTSATHY
jgi:protoporphyrin/coproporphyrin ferrochelatase